MRSHLAAIVIAIACIGLAARTPAHAAPEDDVRSAFSRFVDANNAHDLDEVGKMLADSADFLWISPGDVVRERGAALDRFREIFLSIWRIEPDWSTFEALGLDDRTVEIFVRADIARNAPARTAQMNVLLVRTARGWRVLHIFVSNLPPEGAACDTPGNGCA
jgi:hypothetical protein